MSSAGNTRGLIEASGGTGDTATGGSSSAGNTRGLIEATGSSAAWIRCVMSSAGNTRGLMEASGFVNSPASARHVFRGEYPRPH